jgi:hypothetical protein
MFDDNLCFLGLPFSLSAGGEGAPGGPAGARVERAGEGSEAISAHGDLQTCRDISRMRCAA